MTVQSLTQPHVGKHNGVNYRPRWAVVATIAAFASLVVVAVRYVRKHLHDPVIHTLDDELGG